MGRIMNTANKFEIVRKDYNEIVCFFLSGYLDAHTAPELENSISELMAQGKYFILVNFKNLDYISSAGLGVFMAFVEEIRENNGDIKMSEMTQKVYSVFDLLGFPILFDILDTDKEAIDKFTKADLKKNE